MYKGIHEVQAGIGVQVLQKVQEGYERHGVLYEEVGNVQRVQEVQQRCRTPGCALVLVPAGLLGTGTGTRSTAYNKSIRGTCTPYVHPNAGDSYKRYKKGMRLTGYFTRSTYYARGTRWTRR